MPGMPAIDCWLPPAALFAARSAAFFALCASSHIITAKTPSTATRMASIVETIAVSAWESESSYGIAGPVVASVVGVFPFVLGRGGERVDTAGLLVEVLSLMVVRNRPFG